MIKIKSIKLQNFRLFKNAELSFENKEGVYAFVGVNKDLFSSNSASKSTTAMAIESALFGKNYKNITMSDCSHKYGFQKPVLEIFFDIGEDSFILINDYDQPNNSKIFENGIEIGIKKKPDKLRYIQDKIGINYNIFSSILLLTGDSKLFFMESDSQKQADLIMELLNLNFIGEYYKKAKSEIKLVEKDYDNLRKIINVKKESIEQLNLQINTLPQKQVRNIGTTITKIRQEIADIETEPVSKLLKQSDKNIADLNTEHSQYVAHTNTAERALRKVKSVDKESKCPTCLQDIEPIHHLSLLKEAEEDFEKYKGLKETKYTLLVEAKAQSDKLRKELDELTSKKIKKEYELKQLLEYEEENKAQEERDTVRKKLEERRKHLTLEITEKKLEMDNIEKEIYVYELIKQASGSRGFVNDRIKLFTKLYNKYLNELSNSLLEGKMSVRIEEVGSRQFAVIVSDGEVEFQYKELSAGLEARVKIIAQLALIEVIKVLTKISVNLVFLDEVLANLDDAATTEMEKLFDKLREKFPDKLFLIVSHGRVINNVDGTLLVERENNESKLRWIDD